MQNILTEEQKALAISNGETLRAVAKQYGKEIRAISIERVQRKLQM